MRLFGTARSHFTRKIRLLLDHYEMDYQLIDIGDVSQADSNLFAANPIMSVPILEDKDLTLYDSDHIAQYLVRKLDIKDKFQTLTTDPNLLNARAILNGAMAAEVRLVLAERMGVTTKDQPYFDKAKRVIENALLWCTQNLSLFDGDASYHLFHLVSCYDHVKLYNLLALDFGEIEALVEKANQQEAYSRSKSV